MRSSFIVALVLIVATEGVKALWCHTCVGFIPWPELDSGAEQKASLCSKESEPSELFLRKCQSESAVCGQQFVYSYFFGVTTRSASRGCVEPEYYADQGWQFEMNNCATNSSELSPIVPIILTYVDTCICDQDKCNPVLNYSSNDVAAETLLNSRLHA